MSSAGTSPVDWESIAHLLGERMSHQAHCQDHAPHRPDPECPFCADRTAYYAYLRAKRQAKR